MKNKYFGDVNDNRKYGLLRAMAAANFRLGICWMLTAPDTRTDGSHLAYLENPSKFRSYDPELFDWLQQTMRQYVDDRRTDRIEVSGLLGDAVYFADLLADGREPRKAWFACY